MVIHSAWLASYLHFALRKSIGRHSNRAAKQSRKNSDRSVECSPFRLQYRERVREMSWCCCGVNKQTHRSYIWSLSTQFLINSCSNSCTKKHPLCTSVMYMYQEYLTPLLTLIYATTKVFNHHDFWVINNVHAFFNLQLKGQAPQKNPTSRLTAHVFC